MNHLTRLKLSTALALVGTALGGGPALADAICAAGATADTLDCSFASTDQSVAFAGATIAGASEIDINTSGNQDMSATSGQALSVTAAQTLSTVFLGPLQFSNGVSISGTGSAAGVGFGLSTTIGQVFVFPSVAANVAAVAVESTGGESVTGGAVTVTTSAAAVGDQTRTLPDGTEASALILNRATGTGNSGIVATSTGGDGDDGSNHTFYDGGDGDDGGSGGKVTVTTGLSVGTNGTTSYAIQAGSRGGDAGSGGDGGQSDGGDGGNGGDGGTVWLTTSGASNWIYTAGDKSIGIVAQSVGGGGGGGGDGNGIGVDGGDPGTGGSGGVVQLTNAMQVQTGGDDAIGILAQSVGAAGGGGGGSKGIFTNSNGGGPGGHGGSVVVTNTGSIGTTGTNAFGLQVQSVGGGGGSGGSQGDIAGFGASGGSAANGGAVLITQGGAITTSGAGAYGVLGQSIGGGGGSAGSGKGIYSEGGTGAGGGNGSTVDMTILPGVATRTAGDSADAVLLQSIGGGGGAGGSAGGVASYGGSGSGGGDGDAIKLTSAGTTTTTGSDASGLHAQSIGGGGGDGGGAIAAGVELAVAIGGTGGTGGAGGDASITQTGTISTTGARSNGLLAESIGGGGGSGGYSVAVSVGVNVSAAVSIGGNGGGGGNGALAQGVNEGTITTAGDHSGGVVATSVGGGGGSGGYAAAGSLAAGQDVSLSASIALGGNGNTGGDGGTAYAENAPAGSSASGGGGGNGDDGNGGGGAVEMIAPVALAATTTGPTISTSGAHSVGLLAQSIGGGGGNGGFSVSVAAGLSAGTGLSTSVSLGGAGGSGGIGGDAEADNLGTITTTGAHSEGILVQSIGGGGGSGGSATTGSAAVGKSGSFSASVAVGGSGASGAVAGSATAKNAGKVTTTESLSSGVVAQAIGGGGGNGGHADTYSLSAASGTGGDDAEGGTSVNVSIGIGGSGGTGGTGGTADVQNTGTIATSGPLASGIVSQSIGGGGGSGGRAESVALTATRAQQSEAEGSEASPGRALSIAVDIGGSGGSGGDGGDAAALNSGTITTADALSYGMLVQSVGGGGGSGGNAKSYTATGVKGQPKGTTDKVSSISIEIGGKGGSGGAGGGIGVINNGTVTTTGLFSDAILAQSIGGGGGTGGSAGMYSAGSNLNGNFTFSLGGSGGNGGKGGNPTVENTSAITTTGDFADGLVVQSVGGGGGNAGEAMTDTIGGGDAAKKIGVAVGGSGGKGGSGGSVTATSSDQIATQGAMAIGILAQSVGGGGGIAAEGSGAVSYQLSIGGSGGVAGDGGSVDVAQTGSIKTTGISSYGIFAQSVGGGGGLAGAAVANPNISPSKNPKPVEGLAIGGSGGAAGIGGTVTVGGVGKVGTTGDFAIGVFAQSVGGGGGTAGSATSTGVIPAGLSFNPGGGGSGGNVTVSLAQGDAVSTGGTSAIGVMAQSIGGGGGLGGDVSLGLCFGKSKGTKCVSHDTDLLDTSTTGAAGSGGDIDVTLAGAQINTGGDFAHGIFAQSVGGGGGLFGGSSPAYMASDIGFGGAAGGAIQIALDANSVITTTGDNANGIVAVSHGAAFMGLAFGQPIVVQNAGRIAASGEGSYGVYLNYTAPVSGSTKLLNYGTISGTAGAALINGRDAVVVNSGMMWTFADQASALEVGDGAILINSGTIGASGDSASAVLLDGGGTITNSGVIQTFKEESTAIYATGNLTLTNTGTISAPSKLIGVAVAAGQASIDNAGLISGDVNIANLGGSFVNEATGTLEPYNRLAAGQDANENWGVITDKGTLSPGGSGRGGWPTVYANNYTQAATGNFALDVSEDFTVSDNTSFIGNATFGGKITPTYSIAAGYDLDPMMIASVYGTADTSATKVVNSASVTYTLTRELDEGLTELFLTPAVDLTVAGLTATETSAASYLQSIHDGLATDIGVAALASTSAAPQAAAKQDGIRRPGPAGHTRDERQAARARAEAAKSLPGYDTKGYLEQVLNEPTVAALANSLEAIDFRAYPAAYLAATEALGAVATDMLTCGEQFHPIQPVGGCRWLKAIGGQAKTKQDGLDVTDRSTGLGGGVRFSPDDTWRYDFSAAYVRNTTAAGAADLTTDLFTLGGAATYVAGSLELSAAGMLGYGHVSADRETTDGAATLTASGSTDARLAGARLRAGYAFGTDRLFIKPLLDLDAVALSADGFTESGAGAMNLEVESAHDTLFAATPRVEVGVSRPLDNARTLSAFFSLGASFQSGDINGGARFASLGGLYEGMANNATRDNVLGVIHAGVSVEGPSGIALKLGYGGAYGDNTQANYGTLEVSMRF